MFLHCAWGRKMAEKTITILLVCYIVLFMVQAFKEGSFATESFDYAYQHNEDFSEGVFVQSSEPNQEAWLRQHQEYFVFCDEDAVKVILPSGSLSELKVLGM